jgi:hypothetical protein
MYLVYILPYNNEIATSLRQFHLQYIFLALKFKLPGRDFTSFFSKYKKFGTKYTEARSKQLLVMLVNFPLFNLRMLLWLS